MNRQLTTWFAALAAMFCSALQIAAVQADDTEIYQAEVVSSASARPKVLIVFDDSGSMGDDVTLVKPPYDPDATYNDRFNLGEDKVFWSTDGFVPGLDFAGDSSVDTDEFDRYFDAGVNRCASSFDSLANNGAFMQARARRWRDSFEVPGEIIYSCPDGQSLRTNEDPPGCYLQETRTETVRICDDNWVEVGRATRGWFGFPDPPQVYEDFDGEKRTRDSSERVCYWFGCFNTTVRIWEINQVSCRNETREVTDWFRQGDASSSQDVTVEPGQWLPLDEDVNDPPHVDCYADAADGNPGNGSNAPAGYPQNFVETGQEYGSVPDLSSDLWGDQRYDLYTSHYLQWYYDDTLEGEREKIEIARDVVTNLIETNPGIDFGLMEFNYNTDNAHGGRVTSRIIEDMTDAQRDNLVDIVDAITDGGATPLCESMYEAYRYLSGGRVLWGDNRRTRGGDAQPRDLLAEDGNGNYIAPLTDCAYTYVILMTDGRPSSDDQANDFIETLTQKTCSEYMNDSPTTGMRKNCLPELAEYLANTDLDGDSTNGNQYAITYTIGFLTEQDLLADAAEKGKGEYYTANSAQELAEAFQGAIYSILSTDTTFTSPSVAVDTFTRTESRDEVFYAMFRPTERVNWPGNVKKLKLLEQDGEATLVDRMDNPAIDPDTGFIRDTATTFWSTGQDGGAVEEGGLGGRLRARDLSQRNILINTGPGGSLESFNADNLSPGDFGLSTESALWSLFGASTKEAFEAQVAWAQGYDAYDSDGDESTSDTRDWILGDILHSQPLVVNYGGADEDNPDLRIVFGTNAGFAHMFRSSSGDEDWAFLPKELVSLLPQRRRDRPSSDNVYGLDLTPVIYRLDVDEDGTIEPGDGDKVYLYLGMRRGGRSLYALDITTPGSPSFLWAIDNAASGFGELGYTWSRPAVTFVPGYRDGDGGPHKPVLIFGAGYDENKDATGPGSRDSMGRGVFVVDAATGELVWSVTPSGNSDKNMQETGLLHSVAADVTPVDGNGDGVSDRIYFGDTGGNVWRVDMPGDSLPDATQGDWFIVKLADVNQSSVATDRRIHNAIDVVRTRFNGQAVDALIFATGDRTNPNATDVQNRLYMIRDEAASAYTTPRPDAAECGADDFPGDFRCALPITDSNLYDITSNALASEDEATVVSTLSGASGWRLDLTGVGEKGLAKTVTLGGKIFATTFIPNDLLSNINICEPLSGTGKMYVVNLFDGDRTLLNLAPVIPDTPSVYFSKDGELRLLLPPGTPPQDAGDGIDCSGGICEIGQLFRQPYGNYWMQEEF